MWTGEHAHSIPHPRQEVVDAGRACAPQVADQVFDIATKTLGLLQLALGAAAIVREGASLFRSRSVSAQPVAHEAPAAGLSHQAGAAPTMADVVAGASPMDALFDNDEPALSRLREQSGPPRQFQTSRGRMF